MDLQLKGRRALVTGSSSGIGEGIARMLAEEGCAVVVHGRDREKAEKVAAGIGAVGVAIGAVSSDDGAATVHAEARAALGGPIEVLVNNAGGSQTGSNVRGPLDITAEEWIRNYQANGLAAVRMSLHAVPDMVASRWGRVIQISSAVAVQPNNLGSDYSGAKAAMNNFTVSLAGSLKGVGVTVNTVSPGVILVEGVIRWGREKFGNENMTVDEVAQAIADAGIFEMPPVGRIGTPDDVAMLVCLLASPRSGSITGVNYRVDGGQIRTV
jgi:NAD(P)-dependent dehydrogenase (short-subunit alcohol dehydrogenase family)